MHKWVHDHWVEVEDWTGDQWEKFAKAVKAQVSIEDAIAYAAWPRGVPADWMDLDKQAHSMYGRSLGTLYAQLRMAGRAEFRVAAMASAARSATAAAWVGEKVVGIDKGTDGEEQVRVVVDV